MQPYDNVSMIEGELPISQPNPTDNDGVQPNLGQVNMPDGDHQMQAPAVQDNQRNRSTTRNTDNVDVAKKTPAELAS